MIMRRSFLLLALCLPACLPAFVVLAGPAPTYSVVRVIDGDTIIVVLAGGETRVRLIRVDTPETADPRKPVQFFGNSSSDCVHCENHRQRGEEDSCAVFHTS